MLLLEHVGDVDSLNLDIPCDVDVLDYDSLSSRSMWPDAGKICIKHHGAGVDGM